MACLLTILGIRSTYLARSCIFALFTFPCLGHTNPANPDRISYLEAMVDDLNNQVLSLKENSGSKVFSPPAGPHVSGSCDCFVTGALLYWKGNENGLSYGLKAPLLQQNPAVTGNGELLELDFDGDLGFRVGMGWNTNHDNWDLYLSWTRIHTAAHGHRRVNSERIFPTFADPFYASADFLKASAHLRIHLNDLQFQLGRHFYLGKSLSFRPYVGLENVWISQHYHTHYQEMLGNPNAFDTVHFRNHFWGIGAKAGAQTQWEMRWGISIIGEAALALLYGNFNLKRSSEYSTPNRIKTHIDHKLNQARAGTEFLLGLQWDYLFAHDLFHLGVLIGWEQHIYFGQNQLFNFSSSSPGQINESNNDLTFQGLNFSIRFDF